ncbi:MAG: tetratricopeptide repeat protein [Opitutaceae bacterium]|nr:tetratricopeptide repeat protein [Opitutaceae bacterium]
MSGPLSLSAVRRLLPAAVLLGALAANGPALRAHGDDQALIDALTEQLGKAPDADLYIRRGELFRHQQLWDKADADFASAARLDPSLTLVDFFRARMQLESGAPDKALPLVDRYLVSAPDEPEGRFLRGDILAALGRHDAGALEYAAGIQRAPSPRPEHYLRRARFLAATPNADAARVLEALDDGLRRLGPVIALIDYAIALELERKNYPGALQRIDQAMTHAPRRERWLARQGDVLVTSGRTTEAVAAYRAALAAIEELPERYRDTVPMEKLVLDVRAALARLPGQ